MITIANVIEICSVVNKASSELSVLLGEPVELRLVKPQIPNITYDNRQFDHDISEAHLVHQIISIVCQHYMMTIEELRGTVRDRPFVDARKTATLLMHRYVFGMDHNKIALEMNFNRTMANYNIKQGGDLLSTNKKFAQAYNHILIKIRQSIHNNT